MTWVAANCYSVNINQATELLGYPAQSPGIWIQGNGWQGQFKPDRPWKNEGQKKAAKYRTPAKDSYDAMLPSHPEAKDYWHDMDTLKERCWHECGVPYLLITEGHLKAVAGCSNGLPTIGLVGVEMGLTSAKADPQGKRYLVPTLEKFARAGFNFIIAFDADCADNKQVSLAERKLAHQLKSFGVEVLSVTGEWKVEEGKGMDDFIKQNGIEEFRQVLLQAYEQDWQENEPPTEQQPSKLQRASRAVREYFGHRVRFNELKKEIEIDGIPADLDLLRLDLAEETGMDISKEDAIAIVTKLARQNSYHPVREYLDRVHTEHGAKLSLDDLADKLLGTTNPLYRAYFKRHLIGSVARVYQPGCKMDTALILQGDQGIKKSTFFRTLYGEGWFDDTMASSGDKDELLKLHLHWCVEWAELENIFGRKNVSAVKAFMSTQADSFRPPYGRQTKTFPRGTVLVGTTNRDDFLSDPTGHRRFWVIKVMAKELDLGLTSELRDKIWSAAVAAYKAGEQWWLTGDEARESETENKTYELTDTWQDYIAAFLQDKFETTTSTCLELSKLAVEPGKQDRASQMRVAQILRQLGWYQEGRKGDKRIWKRPTLEVGGEVGGEVGRHQTLAEYRVLEEAANLANLNGKLSENFVEKNQLVENQNEQSWGNSDDKVGGDSRNTDGTTVAELPTSPPTSPPTSLPTYTYEQAWEAFNQKRPYPNLTSDNDRASQKRVSKIREAMMAANTKEDLSALRRENGGEYSFDELKWTQYFIKTFYSTEYNHLIATKDISQPNLLT